MSGRMNGDRSGRRAGRPCARGAFFTCALLLLGFALVWQINLGAQYALDYDEGVFLCSARMALRGQQLFRAVFSSQPPAFLALLALAFQLCGETVRAGREVSVCCALLCLGAVAWSAWRLASPWAAPVAVLALGGASLFFREARTVQAEMPALALALLSLGALLAPRGRRTHAWAAAAGACFALGALTKLLIAPMILPALVLLAVRPCSAAQGWRLPPAPCTPALLRRFLIFGASAAAVCALGVAPWNLAAVYDQVIRFHTEMRRALPFDRAETVKLFRLSLQLGMGTMILAVTGLGILFRKNALAAGWLCLWLLAVGLFVATHAPLYLHHFVLVMPPLAVAASANVLWLPALRPKLARGLVFALLCLLPTVAYVPAAGGDAGRHGSLAWLPRKDAETLFEPGANEAQEQEVIGLIQQHTRADDLVVSDQQMQVFRAARQTPPQLCDTSFARIKSGYLTDAQATSASADSRMIIFWTDRLALLPAYRQWVQAHFRLLRTFAAPPGQVREVYLRD